MKQSHTELTVNSDVCGELPDKSVVDKNMLPPAEKKLVTIFWHSYYGQWRVEFICWFKHCPACGRYYYVFVERELDYDHDYDAIYRLDPINTGLLGPLLDKARKDNTNANLTKAENNPDKDLGEALHIISLYFHDDAYNIYNGLSQELVMNAISTFISKKPKNTYVGILAKILKK